MPITQHHNQKSFHAQLLEEYFPTSPNQPRDLSKGRSVSALCQMVHLHHLYSNSK
jgi:hypothetical protein